MHGASSTRAESRGDGLSGAMPSVPNGSSKPPAHAGMAAAVNRKKQGKNRMGRSLASLRKMSRYSLFLA
jgi:hypothetical protein